MSDELPTIVQCPHCNGYHSSVNACPICNGRIAPEKPGYPVTNFELPDGSTGYYDETTHTRTETLKKVQKRSASTVSTTLTPRKTRTGRKSKYQVADFLFDSETEAWRYVYLIAMQDSGAISNLELQPEYVLRRGYELSGKWYKKTKANKPRIISSEKYHPDFRYKIPALGLTVIEEVKGLSKGKPYSKKASNYKQYTLQETIADRDDVVFWICAGKSDGSVWRYFQQSHGYPELDDLLVNAMNESEVA